MGGINDPAQLLPAKHWGGEPHLFDERGVTACG